MLPDAAPVPYHFDRDGCALFRLFVKTAWKGLSQGERMAYGVDWFKIDRGP